MTIHIQLIIETDKENEKKVSTSQLAAVLGLKGNQS